MRVGDLVKCTAFWSEDLNVAGIVVGILWNIECIPDSRIEVMWIDGIINSYSITQLEIVRERS
jgi:hypothetical protein